MRLQSWCVRSRSRPASRPGTERTAFGIARIARRPGSGCVRSCDPAGALNAVRCRSLDPPPLVGAALLLIAASLLAAYVPPRRAARLDPAGMLRSQ
jgi:hypothetical protein